MPEPSVPLSELAAAVKKAVAQVLGKDVPVEKLLVGFVAPENVATEEAVGKIAAQIGREGGVHAQPLIGRLDAPVVRQEGALKTEAAVTGSTGPEALTIPWRIIIGLIFRNTK